MLVVPDMGIYIGNVYVPTVSEFTADKVKKNTEVIKHLGSIPPHVAEFQADVREVSMTGTLLKVYSATMESVDSSLIDGGSA